MDLIVAHCQREARKQAHEVRHQENDAGLVLQLGSGNEASDAAMVANR